VRQALLEELKRRAGLTDEQARRASEVFEEMLRERGAGSAGSRSEEHPGLFAGSVPLFEERV